MKKEFKRQNFETIKLGVTYTLYFKSQRSSRRFFNKLTKSKLENELRTILNPHFWVFYHTYKPEIDITSRRGMMVDDWHHFVKFAKLEYLDD